MPIIEFSRSSYRALVITAHQHGMSVDRFIRHRYVRRTDASDENDVIDLVEVVTAEGPATPAGALGEGLVSRADAERKGTRVGRHAVSDSSFEALWGRIELNAGREIFTKRGQGFTYEVEAGYLIVRESGTRVPRSQFRKALGQWPATGPSAMRGIYAASVVWAVLAGV